MSCVDGPSHVGYAVSGVADVPFLSKNCSGVSSQRMVRSATHLVGHFYRFRIANPCSARYRLRQSHGCTASELGSLRSAAISPIGR